MNTNRWGGDSKANQEPGVPFPATALPRSTTSVTYLQQLLHQRLQKRNCSIPSTALPSRPPMNLKACETLVIS